MCEAACDAWFFGYVEYGDHGLGFECVWMATELSPWFGFGFFSSVSLECSISTRACQSSCYLANLAYITLVFYQMVIALVIFAASRNTRTGTRTHTHT